MLCTNLRRGPQAVPTAQERDRRAFRAIQARIDVIKGTMDAVGAEADRHWRIACTRVAEADELAQTLFTLTTALARIERRLLRYQAASAGKLNGRAAA